MIVAILGNARAGKTTTAVLLAEELGGRYIAINEIWDTDFLADMLIRQSISVLDVSNLGQYYRILGHWKLARQKKRAVMLNCSYKAYLRRFPGNPTEYADSVDYFMDVKFDLAVATSRRSAGAVVEFIANKLGYE